MLSCLDRLPLLTWIMFLKFLDDLEIQREQEWKLAAPAKSTPHPGPLPGRGGEGKKFKPVIESPYRWRRCGFSDMLPDVLKVRPISDHGKVNEIVDKFGGAEQLREAVGKLQILLYAE